MLSLASGFKWTDATPDFRAYSRRMMQDARAAPFREVCRTYELLTYFSYRMPKLGYRCEELPTVPKRRCADEDQQCQRESFGVAGAISCLLECL